MRRGRWALWALMALLPWAVVVAQCGCSRQVAEAARVDARQVVAREDTRVATAARRDVVTLRKEPTVVVDRWVSPSGARRTRKVTIGSSERKAVSREAATEASATQATGTAEAHATASRTADTRVGMGWWPLALAFAVGALGVPALRAALRRAFPWVP
jgi:hypothetical protein